MIEIIYILIAANTISITLAIYFWRKSKAHKARPDSVELREFLMDLATGGSFLHVKRMDPTDWTLRRSR